MKDMFKKLPTMIMKALNNNKVQKFIKKIDGGWYAKKRTKGLPPLMIQKASKKSQ